MLSPWILLNLIFSDPQHTHQEFLAFFNQLVRAYPRRPLHVVLDNSSTHSTADARRG